jgi:purine-binding chemotaxis protein CheW
VVVGRERYAIELRHVVGIEPLAGLTPLPGVPSFWAGLANVRGTLHPILDLREYLGAAVAEDPTERKLVLVHGAGVSIALLADDVLDVIWIRGDALGPSPHAADTRAVVRGVTADLMALLDLEVLLSDPGLVVDDEAT